MCSNSVQCISDACRYLYCPSQEVFYRFHFEICVQYNVVLLGCWTYVYSVACEERIVQQDRVLFRQHDRSISHVFGNGHDCGIAFDLTDKDVFCPLTEKRREGCICSDVLNMHHRG